MPPGKEQGTRRSYARIGQNKKTGTDKHPLSRVSSAPVFQTLASSNIHDEPALALPAVQRLPQALHIRSDLLEAVAPSLPQAVRTHCISINHWK